jgi:hypothetical protein
MKNMKVSFVCAVRDLSAKEEVLKSFIGVRRDYLFYRRRFNGPGRAYRQGGGAV